MTLHFQTGGPDYYIVGVHDRNRALQGDTVAIQVLPRDKWHVSLHNNLCS